MNPATEDLNVTARSRRATRNPDSPLNRAAKIALYWHEQLDALERQPRAADDTAVQAAYQKWEDAHTLVIQRHARTGLEFRLKARVLVAATRLSLPHDRSQAEMHEQLAMSLCADLLRFFSP